MLIYLKDIKIMINNFQNKFHSITYRLTIMMMMMTMTDSYNNDLQ